MSIEPRVYVTNDKKIPASMSGDAGKTLIVNSTEDGYEHSSFVSETDITGQVIMWPTNIPPSGYLMCNGAEHDTAQYPNLSAILGESSPGKFTVPYVVFPKNSFGAGTLTQEPAGVGTHNHDSSDAGGHGHTVSVSSAGSHSHSGSTSGAGGHSHSTGGGTGNNTVVSAVLPRTITMYYGSSTGSVGDHSHSLSISSAGSHGHSASAVAVANHNHSIQDHVGTTQPACTLLTFCIKT